MKNNALSFIVLLIIWVVLTWSLSIPELLLGVIACLITAYATARLFGDPEISPSNPLKLSWLLVYCAFLIWDCFKASFAALLNVIKPSAPGKAIFFETWTSVRNGTAVGMLMNALSLIPGTVVVSANMKTGSIGIHLISAKSDNYSTVIDTTVKKYEDVLKKVFE
jgi:multisubunit Na+/H+ antiporter MnhE subunit